MLRDVTALAQMAALVIVIIYICRGSLACLFDPVRLLVAQE